MQTQIIEGTLADIQKKMFTLPFNPETRLRVIVTESEASTTPDEDLFQSAPTRNGFIILPTRNRNQVITTDFVNSLLEE